MRLAVFSDFDGTITRHDCLNALVDAFVGAERRRAYDQLFLEGRQSLWQVLDVSLKACAVPLDEAIRYLHAHVEIDPAFAPFHAWCRTREIPLEVVSAGIHEIVASFLEEAGLSVPIQANRAAPDAMGFGLTPMEAACPTGVDKARIVAAARASGHVTAFVGDGISDRLAVKEADLVYAKTGLARYCAERGVPYVPFETFADVQRDLERRLSAR